MQLIYDALQCTKFGHATIIEMGMGVSRGDQLVSQRDSKESRICQGYESVSDKMNA